jgi:hypothetical protein
MSYFKAAIRTALVCLVLVEATNTTRHLRGPDNNNDISYIVEEDLRGPDSYNDISNFVDVEDDSHGRFLQLLLNNGENADDCPLANFTKGCDGSGQQVICAGLGLGVTRGCIFQNDCLAGSAGYLPGRDCKPTALAGQLLIGGLSVSQSGCPNVRPTEFCLDLQDTLVCTGGCEYRNSCFAFQAGFDSQKDCRPAEKPAPVDAGFVNAALTVCRPPDPSFSCTDNVQIQFICGPNRCEYSSTCELAAAGVNVNSCASRCPIVPFLGTFSCGRGGEPVQCNSACNYPNLCQAQSAFSNAGAGRPTCGVIPEETDEEPPAEPPAEVDEGTTTTDPEPDAATVQVCEPDNCPATLDGPAASCGVSDLPVQCKGCCNYPNKCLAAGAGYNTQLQCEARGAAGASADGEGTTPTEPEPDLAPEDCFPISTKIPCTGGPKPVVCRGCEYDNFCFAAGAGFNDESCRLLSDPAPPPPATPAANAAPPTPPTPPRPPPPTAAPQPAPTSSPTPVPAPTCPVLPFSNCPATFDPVLCEFVDLTCKYNNICKAQAATFSSSQCKSQFAPAPAPEPISAFESFMGGFNSGGSGSSPTPPTAFGGGSSPTPPTFSSGGSSPTNFASQFQPAPAPGPSNSFVGEFGGFRT